MNYFYITGTSKGLGKAIVEKILNESNKNFVIGLSRTNSINHKRYKHINFDLSDIKQVNEFDFENHNQKKVVLINNAGIIGKITQVGKRKSKDIIETYNVNTVAPSILMNTFIARFQNQETEKIILNISSGAGRHSIESWAVYCASKSALDMYSLTIFDEQHKIKKSKAVKIFSVAPGIVDTPMQDKIRQTDKTDFPLLDNFIAYKKQNLLKAPKEIAEKIMIFLNNNKKLKSVIYDVREI